MNANLEIAADCWDKYASERDAFAEKGTKINAKYFGPDIRIAKQQAVEARNVALSLRLHSQTGIEHDARFTPPRPIKN